MNVIYDRVLDDEREADIEGGASLPSTGTHLFQIFIVTGTNTAYYWDGSAWIALSGSTPPAHARLLFIDGSGFDFVDGTDFDFIS